MTIRELRKVQAWLDRIPGGTYVLVWRCWNEDGAVVSYFTWDRKRYVKSMSDSVLIVRIREFHTPVATSIGGTDSIPEMGEPPELLSARLQDRLVRLPDYCPAGNVRTPMHEVIDAEELLRILEPLATAATAD